MSDTERAVESGPAKKAVRYGFVDLLRGFALVVMIETHVINAYLPVASRHTWFFFWLSFVNGLVAPTFLFASGFSVMLQGSRQWEGWLRFRLPFWKQMRRLGFITLVAYYSHLQHFKLSMYLNARDPSIWRNSLQVDILQCIVASLLTVHLLIVLLRKPGAVAWGGLALAIAVSISTPLVWSYDFARRLPLSIALYLNPHGISLFPLFPWIFFILCGVFASHLFLKAAAAGSDGRLNFRFFLIGVGLIAAGELGTFSSFSLPGYNSFFTTSPLYLMIRLGCVLIFCCFWYAVEKYLRWMPSPIRVAGQESLLVYGVHLWVIFALLRGKHLGPVFGLELSYPGCFVMSAAIIAVMLWLAGRWHAAKSNYPRFVKRAQLATVAIMIVVFVLS